VVIIEGNNDSIKEINSYLLFYSSIPLFGTKIN